MRKTSTEADLLELARDAGIVALTPKVAYYAKTEEEVELAIREASSGGLSVTARGGGTSIPSQSVGSGAILIQERKTITPMPDLSVVCHPGALKAELNEYLNPQGRWMPVDPSSYASCTLGGMVANNSSGARTLKYGSVIDYVQQLRLAPPGGPCRAITPMTVEAALGGDTRVRRAASLLLENQKSILEERPRVTKNSCGYRLERVIHNGLFDFPKLFVGSEGTFGVFTQITLATKRRPAHRLLFVIECELRELDSAVQAFREESPSALELVDKSVFRATNRWEKIAKYSRTETPYMVFCEFDDDGGQDQTMQAVASSKVSGYDPIVLTSASEVAEAWEARNQTLTLAQELRRGSRLVVPGVEDLVVPPERLGDLVKLLSDQFGRRGLEYISYGHAGDANLHARPLLDPTQAKDMRVLEELMKDCFEAVWRMGGSMTGEHGDGMLRAKYVERQYPRTYWIMRELKDLFDPNGVMNPGVKIA